MDYTKILKELVRILKESREMDQVNLDLASMIENKLPATDKIDYFCKLLEDNNLFPDVASLEEVKNDEKAVEFREEGNAFFKYFKYMEALKAYNKSMCYAASKENLSVGFSNRSAALFMMEKFSECLESIQLAREVGLSHRLAEKLVTREAKCKKEMMKKAPKDAVFVPKIDMPVNEKIPFLAKCLELRVNKIFGRHIVTKEDIPAGTFIAIEEPLCKVLADSNKYLKCATCLAEVPHRLFPCDNCTETMFCSKKCQEEAQKNFHAIECSIIGSLYKIIDDSCHLGMRMTISAFLAFPDIKTLTPALAKIEREQKNVFSFDWTKQLSPEERYTPIHNMAMLQIDEGLKPYVVSSLIYRLLQSSPIFSQRFLTTKIAEDILKDLIFRHYLISLDNGHALNIKLCSYPSVNTTDVSSGCVSYGFRSLLNHSCSENTMTIATGTTSVILTKKNIAAGDQVFTSYGIRYEDMNTADRQKKLLEKFGFHCKCIACVKDFPMVQDLPMLENIPALSLSTLQASTIEGAKKTFEAARDYIRKYHGHHYPNLQSVIAEMQLKYSLNIMCGA